MTIALKIGSEDSQVRGFIYLDAVTTYTKTLGGQVTKHPVDSGVNISDHFISSNQKFTIEGVVSNVDISGFSDLISIGGDKPMNANPRPEPTSIQSQSPTLKYLPTAARQFFERSEARVSAPSQSEVSTPKIEMLLEDLLRATYFNSADKRWRNKMTFTTLYEMNGTNFVNAKTDLVITDISISETADSGDALYLSISLEKIRLVTLDKTDMPKKATPKVKKKVAAKQSQGKQVCEQGVGSTTPATGTTAPNMSLDPNAPKGGANFRAALNEAKK